MASRKTFENDKTNKLAVDTEAKPALTVDIPPSPASITTPIPVGANTVSPAVSAEIKQRNANIARIENSVYYNKLGAATAELSKLGQAMESKSVSPSIAFLNNLFSRTPKQTGIVSPLSSGKPLEFVNQMTPTLFAQKQFGEKAKPVPAYFALVFKPDSKSTDLLKTKFVVTNSADAVVVESADDFKNAKLFQLHYPVEAKQFGFSHVLLVDPEKGQILEDAMMPVSNTHSATTKPK